MFYIIVCACVCLNFPKIYIFQNTPIPIIIFVKLDFFYEWKLKR